MRSKKSTRTISTRTRPVGTASRTSVKHAKDKMPETDISKRKSRNKGRIVSDCWVSINKRLPPNNENDIWTYNNKTGKTSCMPAKILLAQLRQVQTRELFDNWKGKKDPHLYHTGYYVSHWMPVYLPEDLPEDADETPIRHCSICGKRQYPTESGWVCSNGHEGQ